MAMTDPIADMLTRIRNGLTAKLETVTVPASNMKKAIAEILVEEGYIKSATVVKEENSVQDNIVIELKYGKNNEKVISGLKRISRPGLRIYARYDQLPKVLNGLGIAVISTSKGIMTDKKARAVKAGGEVLAYIW
ncbi:MAG: 30S ribosomal protein S8 [Christensenellales bacterium]